MDRKRVSRKSWKAEGKLGRYRRYAKRGKGRFDKRSIRTIRVGRHGKLMRVACPRGAWSPKYKRCRKGMRAYSLMLPVGKNPQKLKKAWVDANERSARLRIGMRHLGASDIAFIKGPKQFAVGLTAMESYRFHELDKKRLKLSRVREGSLWRETKGDVDKIAAWFRKHGFPQQATTLLQWRSEGKLPK